MNTVKHLNDSNLQPLQKKPSAFKHYLACMLLASFMGTYLDLYFVGKGFYQFPARPFSDIFSVNIAFTLVVLPVFVLIFLRSVSQVTKWGKAGIILFISLLMPVLERLAEEFGLFVHGESWEHLYTFFGYLVFWSIVSLFHDWLEK